MVKCIRPFPLPLAWLPAVALGMKTAQDRWSSPAGERCDLMAEFVGFDPIVQVSGEAVSAVVHGMGGATWKALEILAEHNIHNPKWEDVVSATELVERLPGDFRNLWTRHALTPSGGRFRRTPSFRRVSTPSRRRCRSINIAYHMNHRGGEIGTYGFQSTGPRSATMVCRNPYPCAFDRGIIEAMAARFKPDDSVAVSVQHDDSAPCRRHGADSCTYLVTW